MRSECIDVMKDNQFFGHWPTFFFFFHLDCVSVCIIIKTRISAKLNGKIKIKHTFIYYNENNTFINCLYNFMVSIQSTISRIDLYYIVEKSTHNGYLLSFPCSCFFPLHLRRRLLHFLLLLLLCHLSFSQAIIQWNGKINHWILYLLHTSKDQ